MATLASSANVVARVTVHHAGRPYTIHHVEFSQLPRQGNCWTIGSTSTADINVGYPDKGVSPKHVGIGFGEDGVVAIKIFSARGTSVYYDSKDIAGNTLHDCIGEDSPQAPEWAVPIGLPVVIRLGDFSNPLKLTVEVFDHGEHEDEYKAAVEKFVTLRTETTAVVPQNESQMQGPGVQTFMSNAFLSMDVATSASTSTAMTTSVLREGRYRHSFLTVSQKRPGSNTVSKAFATKTWKVYAAEYYNDGNSDLLRLETQILERAMVHEVVS